MSIHLETPSEATMGRKLLTEMNGDPWNPTAQPRDQPPQGTRSTMGPSVEPCLDTQKVYEGRLRELANIEKLEVAEPIQLQEARAQNLKIVNGKRMMRKGRQKTRMRSGADWLRHK